jgi:hypothetical protein
VPRRSPPPKDLPAVEGKRACRVGARPSAGLACFRRLRATRSGVFFGLANLADTVHFAVLPGSTETLVWAKSRTVAAEVVKKTVIAYVVLELPGFLAVPAAVAVLVTEPESTSAECQMWRLGDNDLDSSACLDQRFPSYPRRNSPIRPIASVRSSARGRVTMRRWSALGQLKPVPCTTRTCCSRSRFSTNC